MAFVVTSLGSIGDTAARSTKTCSVFRAPAASSLVLVSVLVSDTAGTPAQPSSVSGSGLIFSIITSSVTYNTIASALHNLSVWRGMGSASIVSSVISANFANSNTGCAMLVVEVTGIDTSGTSGSGAIGQSATTRNDANSGVTIQVPSASSTANAWIAFGGASATGSVESVGVKTEKFTLVDLANYAAPTTQIMSAWTTLSSALSVTIAGGGAANQRSGIMVELVGAGGAAPPPAASVTTGARHQFRLPPVPQAHSDKQYMGLVVRQLNQEQFISTFSAATPESTLTGIPGSVAVNLQSADDVSRLWVKGGSTSTPSKVSWMQYAPTDNPTFTGTLSAQTGMFSGLLTGTTGMVSGSAGPSTFNTLGLLVDQATADDEALTLQSSDVDHGMTALTDTNTFGHFSKRAAVDGGLQVVGYCDSTVNSGALVLIGRCGATAADTTKSTAARGVARISADVKNGTTTTVLGANQNILTVENNGTSRFILDGDGDSHQDVGTAWTNFDEHDDLALLNILSAHVTRPDDPLREGFGDWLTQNREPLERLRLVTFNEDNHHFVNMSRLQMLTVGTCRQLGARNTQLEKRLAALERKMLTA